MRLNLLLVAITFLLSACSTSPLTKEQAQAVPASRVFDSGLQANLFNQATGKVVFIRDSGFTGAICHQFLYVNNLKVAELASAEYIELTLRPGQHFLRIQYESGMCSNSVASQNLVLDAGETQTYRSMSLAGGSLSLIRVN